MRRKLSVNWIMCHLDNYSYFDSFFDTLLLFTEQENIYSIDLCVPVHFISSIKPFMSRLLWLADAGPVSRSSQSEAAASDPGAAGHKVSRWAEDGVAATAPGERSEVRGHVSNQVSSQVQLLLSDRMNVFLKRWADLSLSQVGECLSARAQVKLQLLGAELSVFHFSSRWIHTQLHWHTTLTSCADTSHHPPAVWTGAKRCASIVVVWRRRFVTWGDGGRS